MDGEEESEPDETEETQAGEEAEDTERGGEEAETGAVVDDGEELEVGAGATEEGEAGGLEEIPHDEFEPRGTFAIAFLYLGLLVLLWLFVYFVEFLGRGPTVVG